MADVSFEATMGSYKTTKEMRTEEEVFDWLRDKGILNQFFYCFKNSRDRRASRRSIRELIAEKAEKTILSAFTWANTPQGANFWSDIHNEFKEWY